MLFANPYGLLALLGIPVVILIHFLQRQAQSLPISTLFLLQQTQRESISGRRFDRLTNSIPLWLQILAILLLAWLLAQPRYIRANSTQQLAIVLDSTASMQAFREKLKTNLEKKLPHLQGHAQRLRLILSESDPSKPTIYSGDNLRDALDSLDTWKPISGSLDPTDALRNARSQVGAEGIVIYLTDTPLESLPFSAELLAIGEKTENVGFTGISFEEKNNQLIWRALVKNFGQKTQSPTWQLLTPDGQSTTAKQLTLPPGALQTISGAWPQSHEQATLTLSQDPFPLDNSLPLVRPQPKKLLLASQTSAKYQDLAQRITQSFPHIETTNDTSKSDLQLLSYDPLNPVLPAQPALVFLDESTQGKSYLRGGIVAEQHALMEGLNWQALLVRETIRIPHTESDQVLLWQGQRPLIFLRQSARFAPDDTQKTNPILFQQLIFNFDLSLSNAHKLPATAVLLLRYCNSLRHQKIAWEQINSETDQPIHLAHDPQKKYALTTREKNNTITRPLSPQELTNLRAPKNPSFFTITTEDSTPLFSSASHFADSRESDLLSCDTLDLATGDSASAVNRHTRQDHYWRHWTILLLIATLLAWHFTKTKLNPDS